METKEQNKIYCANCAHCRVIKVSKGESEYVLRIRCAHKQWITKLGKEKTYNHYTVLKRVMKRCEFYESMGSEIEYLQDLKRTLFVNEVYYEKKREYKERPIHQYRQLG